MSVRGIADALLEANDEALKRTWSLPLKAEEEVAAKEGKTIHQRLGPIMSGYDRWLGEIRRAFDPNGAADA